MHLFVVGDQAPYDSVEIEPALDSLFYRDVVVEPAIKTYRARFECEGAAALVDTAAFQGGSERNWTEPTNLGLITLPRAK